MLSDRYTGLRHVVSTMCPTSWRGSGNMVAIDIELVMSSIYYTPILSVSPIVSPQVLRVRDETIGIKSHT